LDGSEDFFHGSISIASFSPLVDVLHGLSETSIEGGLEVKEKRAGSDDISNSHFVSDEEFLTFKSGVHNLHVSLEGLGSFVPCILHNISPSEDTIGNSSGSWVNGGVSE